MSNEADRRVPHLPALDGLRGLAVLAVVGFHASANSVLRGGYLGVDLFFVLSGYLITSILLNEHDRHGTIGLKAFWIRRARRLLPALLLLMPAIAIYAIVVAHPTERAGLRGDAMATLAYVANWRAIFVNKSYWEMFGAPSPLEHTWSLSIEEQFYVVWPLLVAAVLRARRGHRRALLLTVCVVLAIASITTMFVLYDSEHASRVYMGSDTRAAAILLGAVLAIFISPSTTFSTRSIRVLDIAGIASMALLAYAWITLEGESPRLYYGGFLVTEIAALILIVCGVAGQKSMVGRLLSLRPLVFVGTISYGIYLWHWPVDVLITSERLHSSGVVVTNIIRLTVTLVVAMASYRWVERPIRARGIFFGRPIVVVPASFLIVSILLIILTRTWHASAMRPPPIPIPPLLPSVDPPLPNFKSVKSNVLPSAAELPPRTLRVLVIGDSVAEFLGEAMRYQQAPAQTFVAQRGVGGCSIHEAGVSYIDGKRIEGPSCAQNWIRDVEELRPDVTFILMGGAFFGPRSCDVGWRKAYNKRLTFLVEAMGANAGKIILALVPYPVGERRKTTRNIIELGDCFNDELRIVAKAERLATLDLMAHVCPTKECNVMSDGLPIRIDGVHFDGQGTAETARWTLSEINRIALSQPP